MKDKIILEYFTIRENELRREIQRYKNQFASVRDALHNTDAEMQKKEDYIRQLMGLSEQSVMAVNAYERFADWVEAAHKLHQARPNLLQMPGN